MKKVLSVLKRVAIVVLFVAGCSPEDREIYGSDQASLSACLRAVEKTARMHTKKHVSVSAATLTKDTPSRVQGFLTKNPHGNWFECKLMKTGTRGTYWQMRYLAD